MDFPTRVYIHIPFCQSKCPYCSFYSRPFREDDEIKFISFLEKEMTLRLKGKGKLFLETLYIGGGTPSCLSLKGLERLNKLVNNYFHLSPETEFTLEANPIDLTEEKISFLGEMGINRLSLGLQSTSDELLKILERKHSWKSFLKTLELVQKKGFSNISADLIYGLPQQSLARWSDTLKEVIPLKLPHLSIYGLNLENGTVFYTRHKKGELKLPLEETEGDMFLLTDELLTEAGYEHYEIASYAFKGFYSRHNTTYWQNREYVAFGPSAHGYLKGRRYANLPSIKKYAAALKENILPIEDEEEITPEISRQEYMMLGLRLLKGISFKRFKNKYNVEMMDIFGREVIKLENLGLLRVTKECIKLTPKALPVANLVFMEFLSS